MHIVDISIIVAFLATTLYVGFRSGKNIKTFEDYAIGSRKFTDFAIFCTVAATLIGGTTTIGTAGKAYGVGIVHIIAPLGTPIAYLIIASFLARRFSLYYGCCSLGDMFYKAYGIKGKVLIGIIGSLFEIFCVGVQFMAIGTAISVLSGFSYDASLLVAGSIVLLYTGRGGIRAVTFTDVLQFVVLIVALPILLITVLTKIGGFSSLWSQLPQSHVTITGENFNRYIFLMLPLLLTSFSPHHVQRLLMTRNPRQGINAFEHLSWVFLLVIVTAMLLGLSARVLLPGLARPDQALLVLMKNYLPVGVFGFSLAGVMAVLMSSADSNINSGSIVLINDLLTPLHHRISGRDLSEKQKLRLARIFSILIGVGAYIFAKQGTSLFETRIFIRTLWFSVILSPLYFLLFNMKISVRGLITSAIVGLLTFVMWNLNIKPVTKIDGLFPGFFANIITVLFFYFLGGKQKVFSKEHLALVKKMELVEENHKPDVRYMKNRNNVFLGLYLVFLQLVPLLLGGSLTYSKVLLALVNGTLATFLIFGNNLNLFKEGKMIEMLKLIVLAFCLPLTSAYLIFVSPENGLHFVTLALSFLVIISSIDKKRAIKTIFIGCFITCVSLAACWLYNIQIVWPHNFTGYHIFYLLGYLSVFFLLHFQLIALQKEKELAIYQERYNLARSLTHDLTTPLMTMHLLSAHKALNEFNEKECQLYKSSVKEISQFLENFVCNTVDQRAQLQKENLNDIIVRCIEKNKLLHKITEIHLDAKVTAFAKVDAVLFYRVINNILCVCQQALPQNDNNLKLIIDQDDSGCFRVLFQASNGGFPQQNFYKILDQYQSFNNVLPIGIGWQELQSIVAKWNASLETVLLNNEIQILLKFSRT